MTLMERQGKNRRIALIGMTGCGKTTAGRLIASETGYAFVDVDEYIVAKSGRAISGIFAQNGEEYFRKLEYDCLCELLDKYGNIIISCGGGIVVYEPSRKLLSERAECVWIKRSPEAVLKNSETLKRPPANGDAKRYIELYNSRIPLYSAAAGMTVENTSPFECAKKIIKELRL